MVDIHRITSTDDSLFSHCSKVWKSIFRYQFVVGNGPTNHLGRVRRVGPKTSVFSLATAPGCNPTTHQANTKSILPLFGRQTVTTIILLRAVPNVQAGLNFNSSCSTWYQSLVCTQTSLPKLLLLYYSGLMPGLSPHTHITYVHKLLKKILIIQLSTFPV